MKESLECIDNCKNNRKIIIIIVEIDWIGRSEERKIPKIYVERAFYRNLTVELR